MKIDIFKDRYGREIKISLIRFQIQKAFRS